MKRFLLGAAMLGGLATFGDAAPASLPPADLTVELRQVVEGREEGAKDGAVHYTAGTPDAGPWEPQSVQVCNGEKAMLRLMDAIPMQWTQSVSTQNASGNGNNNTNTTQAGVTNALVWFDGGQGLSVQPRWPGGKQPVVLVLEVQGASTQPQVGAALNKQSRNTVSTTLTVPLAQWVTLAATGRPARAGVYSSNAGEAGRRFLQVRVSTP
jgi:hypothetical protein